MAERLLAIEDDPRIAAIISQIARDAGYEPYIACEPASIQPAYEAAQPHVILLDILMPDIDGFDVLNFLGDQHCTAKIIILSGSLHYRDMAEKMGEGRGLRIVGNISKPFRNVALREALLAISQPEEPLRSDQNCTLSAAV